MSENSAAVADRAIAIRSSGGDEVRVGTGFILETGRLLTAWHVVEPSFRERREDVELRFSWEDGRDRRSCICVCKLIAAESDLALVAFRYNEGAEPRTFDRANFGHLNRETQQRLNGEGYGFPDAVALDPDGEYVQTLERIFGQFDTATGNTTNSIHIEPTLVGYREPAAWQGASGTAIADDRGTVFAVILQAESPQRGVRLVARETHDFLTKHVESYTAGTIPTSVPLPGCGRRTARIVALAALLATACMPLALSRTLHCAEASRLLVKCGSLDTRHYQCKPNKTSDALVVAIPNALFACQLNVGQISLDNLGSWIDQRLVVSEQHQ